MSITATVKSIHRYPVKSMAGEELDSGEITEGGLTGDRMFALRDLETDRLVSAKRPRLWGKMLECTATTGTDHVQVALPDGTEMPLADSADHLGELFERPVAVESFTQAKQGSYGADWPDIEGFVWAGRDDLDFEVNLAGEHSVGFVDVFPIHFITTSALALLRAEDPELVVDERRFRPTMVIDTGDEPGFPELDWIGKELQIGGARFYVVVPTLRCVMAATEQRDLPRQLGLLKTLARVNGDHATMDDGESGRVANFGVWADVIGAGEIKVGDAVSVEESADEQ